MPQAYAQGQWPWQVENPQTGFASLRDIPFGGPTSVHFADQAAANVGLEGLRLLPARVREFLLRHPDPVTVRSFDAEPGHGVGRFLPDRTPGLEKILSSIELDPRHANPGVAAEELLHAADYLKTGFFPSLGARAGLTAAAERYRLSGMSARADPLIETFIAPTIRNQGPMNPLYRDVFALLRDPAVREHLLNALSTLNAGP